MFPRYLFVAVDPDVQAWRAIRSTIGVADLVSFGDRPATVPQEIIDEILARQDEQGLVRTMDVAGSNGGCRTIGGRAARRPERLVRVPE